MKWSLCYLKSTYVVTLPFRRKKLVLEGFNDVDKRGSRYLGKTITGFLYTIAGITISWISTLWKEYSSINHRSIMNGN